MFTAQMTWVGTLQRPRSPRPRARTSQREHPVGIHHPRSPSRLTTVEIIPKLFATRTPRCPHHQEGMFTPRLRGARVMTTSPSRRSSGHPETTQLLLPMVILFSPRRKHLAATRHIRKAHMLKAPRFMISTLTRALTHTHVDTHVHTHTGPVLPRSYPTIHVLPMLNLAFESN